MKQGLFWLTLGGAAVATAVSCALAWFFMLSPMQESVKVAGAVRDAFDEALNLTPRIMANNAVLFSQNTPVLELTTAQRTALVRHELSEKWLHSRKEFSVEAQFTARAGFGLREPLVVNVVNGGRTAEIVLPRAKILSLEMSDFRVLRDENGLWNRLTAADRERGVRALEKTARREFAATDLVSVAEQEGRQRIRELVARAGAEAVFIDRRSDPEM